MEEIKCPNCGADLIFDEIYDDLYENDVAYQEVKKVKVSLEERNQTLSNTIKELKNSILI